MKIEIINIPILNWKKINNSKGQIYNKNFQAIKKFCAYFLKNVNTLDGGVCWSEWSNQFWYFWSENSVHPGPHGATDEGAGQ